MSRRALLVTILSAALAACGTAPKPPVAATAVAGTTPEAPSEVAAIVGEWVLYDRPMPSGVGHHSATQPFTTQSTRLHVRADRHAGYEIVSTTTIGYIKCPAWAKDPTVVTMQACWEDPPAPPKPATAVFERAGLAARTDGRFELTFPPKSSKEDTVILLCALDERGELACEANSAWPQSAHADRHFTFSRAR